MGNLKSIIYLAALSTVHATVTPGSLITISTAVDANSQAAWWNPLDEYGGYDWLVYLRNPPGGSTANNNVMVARRSISDGTISRDCVKTSAGECAVFADDLGNNTPSISVDGNGYVHVFTSMHNEPWQYFRSDTPYSSTLVDANSEMPDQTTKFTYPVVKRDADGNLWLIIRGQAPNDNNAKGGYFYKYSTNAGSWSCVAIWAYNKGYSVYPDDIAFSSDGDVHLQWEWSKYPASAVRHQGSYARYNPSTNTFTSASGATLSVPITQNSANVVYQPLTSGETYSGDINASPGPAFQSAKMALYEKDGSLHIQHAYRFKTSNTGPWQVRRAIGTYGTQDPWKREILYQDTETSATVGITHDGTSVRIYYCRSSASAYVLENVEGAGWTNTALEPVIGKKVQRLQALMRSDGIDVLYLGSPTNVNSTTGSLYLMIVGGRD
ncbi:hypothetical protein FPOAC2_07528 [Fusarium poae]|uniref:hypothetical protein n=1 Tax=Fusarium poae TaxID=36050 RepID=UPI001CE9237E|nr:hypothetical protein FPOAC1_007616 [Fusarium poae]KAG8668238.1 hypothetical protein FPOAC1_007616 [Fusarium poae]